MEQENIKGLDTFDKVVVLMLENRSFDNLLGYLYKDGVPKGKSFEGLQGTNYRLPVPSTVNDHDKYQFLSPYMGGDYHQPFPDPGEVYQHVNSQIYNHIDNKNKGKEACHMKHPYNIPKPEPKCPPMTGFITDYVNTLKAIKCTECRDCEKCKEDPLKCDECLACEGYHDPAYDQYHVIMQCFEPEKVNVMSTLAKEFAVFDRWHCSVPSQTWCNRAFWHAGTSGGKVVNPTDQCSIIDKFGAMAAWMLEVWTKKTLFERMEEHNVSHAVYTSGLVSLTTLVNGPFKDENVVRSGENLDAFKADIASRNLPDYSFIEPKFFGQHNDQHPSSAGPSLVDGPTREGSVKLGEHLIWDVYNTIQKSAYQDRTLLIITHDEHGGCYDHVPPPPCKGSDVVPPEEHMWFNQKGFDFKRLGVRVPMVMVSAFIEPKTIMNDTFDHTSFIKTMCKKWGMKGLTDRDKAANSFENVFSTKKRSLPPIKEPFTLEYNDSHYDNDTLNDLQNSMLETAHVIASLRQKEIDPFKLVPSIDGIKTVKQATLYLESIQDLLKGIA